MYFKRGRDYRYIVISKLYIIRCYVWFSDNNREHTIYMCRWDEFVNRKYTYECVSQIVCNCISIATVLSQRSYHFALLYLKIPFCDKCNKEETDYIFLRYKSNIYLPREIQWEPFIEEGTTERMALRQVFQF